MCNDDPVRPLWKKRNYYRKAYEKAAEFSDCYQPVGHESFKSASKPVGRARPWSGSIANTSISISSVPDASNFTTLATRISRRMEKKTIRGKGQRTGTSGIFEGGD
ncbi:hypothetical protein T4C_9300 [Trichinella pseudospiralis]|uniref:Uncharacterized protein n=1 Tax=Trichinella pseudospiralis TaxID=6337 RepID=A0A0V1K3K8_TRIPS|nr:hypothetical protein T4C_9300 [Trichinella pseudospiralis]